MQQLPNNKPTDPIRALVVDDHGVMRDAVTTTLLSSAVVGGVDSARSLQEAREMLTRNADYKIVVLDLNLVAPARPVVVDLARPFAPVRVPDDALDHPELSLDRLGRGVCPACRCGALRGERGRQHGEGERGGENVSQHGVFLSMMVTVRLKPDTTFQT